mmetsp:Transcript_89284/g.249842  ORF Transcript_89284/g.249842 Transcript_89284/m.249842 type:complete len:252 (-) Transcript_89284:1-756(-)
MPRLSGLAPEVLEEQRRAALEGHGHGDLGVKASILQGPLLGPRRPGAGADLQVDFEGPADICAEPEAELQRVRGGAVDPLDAHRRRLHGAAGRLALGPEHRAEEQRGPAAGPRALQGELRGVGHVLGVGVGAEAPGVVLRGDEARLAARELPPAQRLQRAERLPEQLQTLEAQGLQPEAVLERERLEVADQLRGAGDAVGGGQQRRAHRGRDMAQGPQARRREHGGGREKDLVERRHERHALREAAPQGGA